MSVLRSSRSRARRWIATSIALLERQHPGLAFALAAQLEATTAGAVLVGKLVRGEITTVVARSEIHDIEHDGDTARRALVDELGTVLASPIDGEDLFRLSRSIDDVLDNLRDFVREADLFRCDSLAFATALVDALHEGLGHLGGAVQRVIEHPGDGVTETLAARKAAGRVRQLYQVELAELFATALSSETLKRRELLRRLDVVALRLGEAADALADGELKRYR